MHKRPWMSTGPSRDQRWYLRCGYHLTDAKNRFKDDNDGTLRPGTADVIPCRASMASACASARDSNNAITHSFVVAVENSRNSNDTSHKKGPEIICLSTFITCCDHCIACWLHKQYTHLLQPGSRSLTVVGGSQTC